MPSIVWIVKWAQPGLTSLGLSRCLGMFVASVLVALLSQAASHWGPEMCEREGSDFQGFGQKNGL